MPNQDWQDYCSYVIGIAVDGWNVMFSDHSVLVFLQKFKKCRHSSYGWEITLALLVKFLLLGGLWWAFFFGNKQTVDEWVMAGKIFGENRTIVQSHKSQERP